MEFETSSMNGGGGRTGTQSPSRLSPLLPPRRPASFRSSRPLPPSPPPDEEPPAEMAPPAVLTYIVDESAGHNTIRSSFEPPVGQLTLLSTRKIHSFIFWPSVRCVYNL